MSATSLRIAGLGLLATALVWTGGWMIWLVAQHRSGHLDPAATVLGFLLFALLPAAAGLAGGALLLVRAARRGGQQRAADLERRLADAVRTRGVVHLNALAREWGVPEPQLRRGLEALVGLELFHGTVDWAAGEVRAPSASLGSDCPRCGAELEPAGQGLLACRYCGAHFPDAAPT